MFTYIQTDAWLIAISPEPFGRGIKMQKELWRQELLLIKWLKLTKGHNSGKKQSSVTSV